MTKNDPTLPMSLARERMFYGIVKSNSDPTKNKVKRSFIVKLMNCSMATFQHEYTGYMQSYPQIKYLKETKEFVFDP